MWKLFWRMIVIQGVWRLLFFVSSLVELKPSTEEEVENIFLWVLPLHIWKWSGSQGDLSARLELSSQGKMSRGARVGRVFVEPHCLCLHPGVSSVHFCNICEMTLTLPPPHSLQVPWSTSEKRQVNIWTEKKNREFCSAFHLPLSRRASVYFSSGQQQPAMAVCRVRSVVGELVCLCV